MSEVLQFMESCAVVLSILFFVPIVLVNAARLVRAITSW